MKKALTYMKFDIRGFLVPYEKNTITFEQFETLFVKPFNSNSTRHEIFENYKRYVALFAERITGSFTHWINGSFVSRKTDPQDIDFVSFVDQEVVREKRQMIEDQFLNMNAIDQFNLDAYMVRVYDKDHHRYEKYQSDLVYWSNWFGASRKNKDNKRDPKGFVEINYNLDK